MLTNTMKEDLTQGLVDIFSDSILAIILYGSVARNDNTDESDIDIVIIIKNEMDDATKERFIHWSAELDLRYDRVFSIIDIQEENMEKWGYRRRELFFGRQFKGTHGKNERSL